MTQTTDNGADGPEETVAPFTHEIRVRYGECDMQGIVFNAHYLAYVDDALGEWFREKLGTGFGEYFDCMVKKAEIEWDSPAKAGETLRLLPRVDRWGRSSFDVLVDGTAGERSVFSAKVIYVSVDPGTHEPCITPDAVRLALSDIAEPGTEMR